MRKLILFVFLLSANVFHAKGGNVEGTVIDRSSRLPVSGATIYLADVNQFNLSDAFGNFKFKNIKEGNYALSVSVIGYRPERVVIMVEQNTTARVSILIETSNLNLSEVVVRSNHSSSINTVAALDIKLRPVNTSQDILRMVPGLFIAQHAGGGKADQLFLRGYDVDHGTDIAETVDGMPVNMVSHAHGQGYADLHFLIPELVDKVDFDKGRYNTNKGNLATAGWIDFQTKNFLKESQLKLEGGSFNYQRAAALLKLFDKTFGNTHQQFYVATEYFKNNSYFDDPQHFHRFNVFGKYSFINSNTQFYLSASTFNSRWNASGQIPLRAVDSGTITRFGSIDNSEGGYTARTNLNARLVKQLKNNWSSSQQLYYSNYHFDLCSNFTFFLNDPVNGDEINQREGRNFYGYKGSLEKEYYVNGRRWSTNVGYGFRYDDIKNSELNHVVKRQFLEHITSGDIREWNSYASIQQDIKPANNWSLSLGLRYDHFNFGYKDHLTSAIQYSHQTRSVVSPKGNVSFSPSRLVTINLSSGLGFHSNDVRVIMNREAKNILPTVFGTDLGVLIKPLNNLLLKATVWQLHSQQEFVYVGDEGIVEPAGRSQRTGFDFSGRYQPASWLYLDLDLNFAKPRLIDAEKGADHVPLAPTFTSIGGLTFKTKKGFNGSLRYRYLGDRPANEENTVTSQGYFIADAVASYRVKRIELQLTVENIFNTAWREAQFNTVSRLKNESAAVSDIDFTPGTPRFIKAGIVYNF